MDLPVVPPHRPPPLTPRALKKWSPILPSERDRVQRMLERLRSGGVKNIDDRQRIADALRPPMERVDRVATAGYMEIGRWLGEVKSLLPHGAFLTLFQGHGRGGIATPLPLSVAKAQALMRVAAHPVLSDAKNFDHLPIESWRTLDELTRLPPSLDLQALIASGRISRETKRREVIALQGGGVPPRRTPRPVRRRGEGVPPGLVPIDLAIARYRGPDGELLDYLRGVVALLEARVSPLSARSVLAPDGDEPDADLGAEEEE